MLIRWSLLSCVCALSLSAIIPAAASSSAAWDEFRRDVERSCREASANEIRDPQIVVDPFGLQSYGLAFLNGSSVEDGTPLSLVCVFDKVERTVEIGGTLALERSVQQLAPTQPALTQNVPSTATDRLLSPSALSATPEIAALEAPAERAGTGTPQCDAQCESALDGLNAADRQELIGLPEQIERTVAAAPDASLGATVAAIRAAGSAAAAVARGQADGGIARPEADFTGAGSCTLYYFGLDNEAARMVGTHQCRVTADEGDALVFEKTSGERLRAELRPFSADMSAFVGRTFEAGGTQQEYDAENPEDPSSSELGNTVGFAAVADDSLLLISSQRRRFESSDSFFWVLAMDRP